MDTKSNDDSGGSDSLDKSMQRKCVMVETMSSAAAMEEPDAETDNCSRDSAALQETPPPGEPKTDSAESSMATKTTTTTATTNSNNNNNNTTAAAAFETKVKLISQNLKETKLAETTTTTKGETQAETEVEAEDDCDNQVKKVHFHPDVKENDGGNNRVKKKWKSAQNQKDNDNAANQSCDDGMEMDEDDEETAEQELEDEEFNLAKTIAEAEDYLKQHPLTFVRRVEQNGEIMRDGSLEMEQIPQLDHEAVAAEDLADDNDSEADFYKKSKPENGIERVLGKETKAGKVEFLLRYENQGGLFWESEEYIRRMCPTLLRAYEKNRERRQQRLMHHVARRQSMRQRYTDF